jgi:hypothetical protein
MGHSDTPDFRSGEVQFQATVTTTKMPPRYPRLQVWGGSVSSYSNYDQNASEIPRTSDLGRFSFNLQ